MKKFLILSVFALSILSLSACGQTETPNTLPGDLEPKIENSAIENETSEITRPASRSNDCPEICQNALTKCATLTENDCLYKCQNATNVEKACLKTFKTCEELARNCRQPSDAEEKATTENNCVAACNNYVLKCISQVPNATELLKKDAYNSCMGECVKWNSEKINCMSISPTCEGFTNQCGL
jgi:carboxypeptidase C (cathepsin A)